MQRDIVASYAALVGADPDARDEEVESALVADGYAREEAQLLLQIAPLAFGRVILAGLGCNLHPEFIVLASNGLVIRRTRFTDDPWISALMQFAHERSDVVVAVGPRSSEVSAVNEALHAGSEPRSLVLSPAIVFRGRPSESGLAAAQQFMSEGLHRTNIKADVH